MPESKPSYYSVVPATVRYDRELSANAKLLYGEIAALCNETGRCWATNQYFADLYGVDKSTITRWVKELVAREHIVSDVIYKEGTREIADRYLQICGEGIRKNAGTPTRKNAEDNNTLSNTTLNTPPTPKGDDAFDAFWMEYPRKVGKPAALRAWRSLHVTALDIKPIMDGLATHKRSEQWTRNNGQFIPHPSTWLNQRRWEGMTPDQPVQIEQEERRGFIRYGGDS